jgi:hypothetical protein
MYNIYTMSRNYVIMPKNPPPMVGMGHCQHGGSIFTDIYRSVIKPVYKKALRPVGNVLYREVVRPTYKDFVRPVGGTALKGLDAIGLKPSDILSATAPFMPKKYGVAAGIGGKLLKQKGLGRKKRKAGKKGKKGKRKARK